MNRTALLVLLAASTAMAAPKKGPKKEPEPPPAPKEEPAPPPPPVVTPPPRTANQRIVGVLDVRVEGVPPEISAQFQQQLETQVDTRRFWLAPRSRMHEVMSNSTKWTEGCVIGNCLGEVRRQTNADLVLLAALTGSGTSFGYVVTLVRTDTGRVLAQESERCDVCTVSEAVASATQATVKILNAVPDTLPDENKAHAYEVASATEKGEHDVAEAKHHSHAVATGLVITGLTIAVGGVAAYVAESHPDYALAVTAGGAGLALGGAFALSF